MTLAEDLVEGAALLPDVYAASGMSIVLSGADSLVFRLCEGQELYDRCTLIHTTLIPYHESERVLGISGIDEHIRHGGSMCPGERRCGEGATFETKATTDEYIDTAIAGNIRHSLQRYPNGGHFRHLSKLSDGDELASAGMHVVEDINHRFAIEAVTRDVVSHDLGTSGRGPREDGVSPTNAPDGIDDEAVTEGLLRALTALGRDGRGTQVTDAQRIEIKECLDLMDLTRDIPTESIPVGNGRSYRTARTVRTAMAKPGMRYSQAEACARRLLLGKEFRHVSARDRVRALGRIMSEVKGRMIEDLVLLETTIAHPEKEVFRLQFATGVFDMVVLDPDEVTCEVYAIGDTSVAVPDQYKDLIDAGTCEATEFRFGDIRRKAVIYRGDDWLDGDIEYLNVEYYLRGPSGHPKA